MGILLARARAAAGYHQHLTSNWTSYPALALVDNLRVYWHNICLQARRNDNTQLWNDFNMHSVVMAMFAKHKALTGEIQIPRCQIFILVGKGIKHQ